MGKEDRLLTDVSYALAKNHDKARFHAENGRCVSAGFVVERHSDANAARVSYRFKDGSREETNGIRILETILGNYITTLQKAGFRAEMFYGGHTNRPFLKVVKP